MNVSSKDVVNGSDAYMAVAFAIANVYRQQMTAVPLVKYCYKRYDGKVSIKFVEQDDVQNRNQFCRMCGVPYDEMVQFCNFKDTAYLYATKV